MDRSGYLEAAGQRFTEFGGFAPVAEETLPPLMAEWADLVLERVEAGLTTRVAFVPLQAGSLLPAVRDEMAEHLAEAGRTDRRELLGVLVLVTEERINREIYDRAQSLVHTNGRVRVVPWFADLHRGRLFGHDGPPFGIDPDLYMLAEPALERPEATPAQQAPLVRRPDQVPWLTVGLAAILVAIWVAMSVAGRSVEATENGEMLYNWGAALRPYLLMEGEYWRLFTAGFLHIGVAHLFMNTLSLWWVGQMVEALYGRIRTLAIYLIALVAGAAASLMFGPPAILSAGASGAIFGLLGAALWYQLTGPDRERLKRVPLLMVLGINLVYGLILSNAIDNWNHMGGLVGGFVAAAATGVPKQSGPRLVRAALHTTATLVLVVVAAGVVMGRVDLPGPSQRLAGAMSALESGRIDQAEAGVAEAARRQPEEPRLRLLLAYIYYEQGRFDEARTELEKALVLDPGNPDARELERALPPPDKAKQPKSP